MERAKGRNDRRSAGQAARLDGTPVFLDEETMMPVPPLCEWGRYLSTALLDGARKMAGSAR